jgi:hypothetical protein
MSFSNIEMAFQTEAMTISSGKMVFGCDEMKFRYKEMGELTLEIAFFVV